jgi:hypothetical protein
LTPGVRDTGMPFAFAASRSIVSTPTPCLQMILSFFARARSAARIGVMRTMTPSASSAQFLTRGSSQRTTSACCAA